MLRSKEYYDMMATFEKNFSCERFDKEDKELWSKGIVYQSGEVNKLFRAFELGYSSAKQEYQG